MFQWINKRLVTLLEDNKPKSTIAALDGVRAIACLIVISFHVSLVTREKNIWYPNDVSHRIFSAVAMAGASGVTLFFVLSGFLLFMPYAKALLFDSTWPSARLFYLRRAFRIIPAYYASLFLLILISQRQYLQRAYSGDLGLFLTFFMDSSPTTNHKLNGPFWTLAVEWQFYLLLPLLAFGIGLLARRGSLSRRIATVTLCLLGVIAWGIFSHLWGNYFVTHPARTFLVPRSDLNVALFYLYGSAGKFLEDFAVGMLISLCYIYTRHATSGAKFRAIMPRLSIWLWRLGILELFFMALWHFNQDTHEFPFLDGLYSYYSYLNEICLSIGFGLCIIAILFGSDALKRPFEWAPLRWLGLISFSLYMWHLPFLIFFMNTASVYMQGWNRYVAYSLYWWWVLLIIVPFSFLFYLLIEKPWMKVGDRLKRRLRLEKEGIDIAPTSTATTVNISSAGQSLSSAESSKDTVTLRR